MIIPLASGLRMQYYGKISVPERNHHTSLFNNLQDVWKGIFEVAIVALGPSAFQSTLKPIECRRSDDPAPYDDMH